MQDRFKLRAWDAKTQTMCYDTPPNAEKREYYPVGIDIGWSHYDPDQLIIMQCTGIPDKNGYLYYENDLGIIEFGDSNIVFKVYYTTAAYIGGVGLVFENVKKRGDYVPLYMLKSSEHIGDAYQNPELWGGASG